MPNQENAGQLALLDLLDQAPMNVRHYRIWAFAAAGTLMDGLSVFLIGIAMPLLSRRFGLSAVERGLLGSMLVVGAVAGASLGGRLSDAIGRRGVMLLDMLLVAAATAVTALAPGTLVLLAGELLLGVGVGMDFPTSGAYISEVMPARDRPRILVATISFQSVGMLVGAAVAILLLTAYDVPRVWRLMLGTQTVVAVLMALGRLSVPESPRWLMSRGRNTAAASALTAILTEKVVEASPAAEAAGTTPHRVTRGDAPENGGFVFGRGAEKRGQANFEQRRLEDQHR